MKDLINTEKQNKKVKTSAGTNVFIKTFNLFSISSLSIVHGQCKENFVLRYSINGGIRLVSAGFKALNKDLRTFYFVTNPCWNRTSRGESSFIIRG